MLQAVKDYQSQQRFFLDEIQSQLSKNAELQRAKLDKLLTQSKSEQLSSSSSAGLYRMSSFSLLIGCSPKIKVNEFGRYNVLEKSE